MSLGAAFGAFGESFAKATMAAKKMSDDAADKEKQALSTTTPAGSATEQAATSPAARSGATTPVDGSSAAAAQMAQTSPASGGSSETPAIYDLSRHAIGGGGRPDALTGLQGGFSGSLQRMFAEAPEEIRSGLKISSAYRSPQRQAEIIAENMGKYGFGADQRTRWLADVKAMGPEAAGARWAGNLRGAGMTKMVGLPGRSNHQRGEAVDLKYGSSAARQWVHANAGKYGLHFPMAWEDWHIEPIRDRGTRAVGITPGQKNS
jgi:LAS superfamily LD-carboxypeptidase LdcB